MCAFCAINHSVGLQAFHIEGVLLTFSMNRSVGAKRPLVALAAVNPRVMCGAKMWLASKREPSPPLLMNRSCRRNTCSASSLPLLLQSRPTWAPIVVSHQYMQSSVALQTQAGCHRVGADTQFKGATES